MISDMQSMTSWNCSPLAVFLTYCFLPSKQCKKSTHSACMRIKYLSSKLMGKHKQKTRAEPTSIHTFVAKIFYSLSSSICNWLVLTNTLQTALRSEKHFAFFHFGTTNVLVTRPSLWLAGREYVICFSWKLMFGESPDKNVRVSSKFVFQKGNFFDDSQSCNTICLICN